MRNCCAHCSSCGAPRQARPSAQCCATRPVLADPPRSPRPNRLPPSHLPPRAEAAQGIPRRDSRRRWNNRCRCTRSACRSPTARCTSSSARPRRDSEREHPPTRCTQQAPMHQTSRSCTRSPSESSSQDRRGALTTARSPGLFAASRWPSRASTLDCCRGRSRQAGPAATPAAPQNSTRHRQMDPAAH